MKGRIYDSEGRIFFKPFRIYDTEGRIHDMKGRIYDSEGRIFFKPFRIYALEAPNALIASYTRLKTTLAEAAFLSL